MRSNSLGSFLTLLCVLMALNPVFSQSTWNGGSGADNNWTSSANWGGTAPVATNSLSFGGSTRLTPSNNFTAATNFAGITFNSGASAFTLSGNSISLGGNVTNSSASLQTINHDMIMTADRTFNASTAALAVGGVISGSGFKLIKAGSSTLTLTATNSYTGGTTLNNGTISFSSSTFPTGPIVMDNGTTLSGSCGCGVNFNNSISLTSGTATIPVPFGGGADITLNGVISGSGGLNVTGGNGGGRSLILTNANTFSGGITQSYAGSGEPNIRFSNVAAFGTGTFTTNITSVDLLTAKFWPIADLSASTGVTNAIVLNGVSSRLAISASSTNHLKLSGIISGAGYIGSTGDATVTLTGTNTFTGGVIINAGTFSVSTIGDGGVSGNLGQATNAAANLTLGGGTLAYSGSTASSDRNFTLTASTTSGISVTSGSTTLTLSGTSTATNGSLTKSGSGTLVLSGTNLYTGATSVNAGTLRVASIGNGSVAGNLGQASNAAANLNLGGGILLYSGTTASTDRNFTLSTSTTSSVSVFINTTTLTLAGASVSTNGALTKIGFGTLILTGSNLNTGLTTVTDGVLELNHSGGTTIPNTNSVTVNGGTLKVSSNQTIANLTLSSGTLIVDAGVTLIITGTYSGGGTINNLGTITLQGATLQTFPGGSTTVNNGTSGEMTNLTINNSNNVTLDKSFTVSGALNMSAGYLSIGSNTLTMSGTFSGAATKALSGSSTSNLVIASTVGTVYFNQTTPGTTNLLHNLTIGSGSTASMTLGSALNINSTGLIAFNAAGTKTLTITGQTLTLLSDASGSAMIDNTNSATITGNITVERYIPANGRKYRFLASPVIGGTSLQWRNNATNVSGQGLAITGSSGTNDASIFNASSAFNYDETSTSGANTISSKWTPIDGNTTLTNGSGYRVFVRGDRSILLNTTNTTNNSTTIWVKGTYPSSAVACPVTFTSSSSGWNLIGNPYPCTIDWSAIIYTDRTNINNAIYTWNPTNTSGGATGGYATYANGVGSGTPTIGTQYVSSGQAFFVKAIATSPNLTIRESHKVSSQAGGSFFKNGLKPNSIRLNLSDDSTLIDDAVLYFENGASKNFDGSFDAYDLTDMIGWLSDDDSVVMCISGNPEVQNNDRFKIAANLGSGSYKLSFTDLTSFNVLPEAYLSDKFLNQHMKLAIGSSYAFLVDTNNHTSFGNNRFELVFGTLANAVHEVNANQQQFVAYPNPAASQLNLVMTGMEAGTYTYTLLNALGQEMQSGSLPFVNGQIHQLNVESLSNGMYELKLNNGNGCQVIRIIK